MGVWFYRNLATAGGNGLSWATARQSLATMTSVVAGDTIWVSDDHNESTGAAVTITFPGTQLSPNVVICADHNVASPTFADWKTTGVVSTLGTFGLSVVGSAYIYGLSFIAAIASAAIAGLSIGQGGVPGVWQYFDTCLLRLATTSASGSSRLTIGATGNNVGSRVTLDNTQMDFAHVAQNVSPAQGRIEWRNTANPFAFQVPTTLVSTYSQPFTFTFEAVDFLLVDAGKTLFGAGLTYYRAAFYGCRIGGSGTVTAALTTPGSDIILCNAGVPSNPALVSRYIRYTYEGTELTDVTLARAGGASDGTRAFSRSLTPNANTLPHRPYSGSPIVKWNTTVDADVTVTLYGIKNLGGGVPYNHQIWFEVQYLGDATSPLMTIDHCGLKPNYLASVSQWTADDSDWTAGIVNERLFDTNYGANQAMKVSSNPGRIFFCTTAGKTHATVVPAAFATAVDGDSNIQDGTAFFRCGTRFKVQYTLTAPQVKLAGPIYVIPRMAGMSGTAAFFWIDPVIG